MNPSLQGFLPKNWLNIPTEKDIDNLPTIDEVKEKLLEYENTYPVIREESIKEWKKSIPNYLDETGLSYSSSNKDEFILTKTFNAWTLKPNISMSHFLYRGEKQVYETCLPTLYRYGNFNHLIENIKRAEFEILLESHPIFKLFKDGIALKSGIIVKLNNPYGLAQHYSFNTVLLDLTSDIEVATFFATCEYDSENCRYNPVLKPKSFGVLYVYHITKPFFFNNGLSTIGLQSFVRPGLQKGFLWNSHPDFSSTGKPYDLNECEFVTKVYFKHDESINRRICSEAKSGEQIFPEDELSIKCKDILKTKVFSEEAFNKNLSENPQDTREKNLNILGENDYQVSAERKPLLFTKDDRDLILSKIFNGGWDKLCDSIVMPIDKDGSLMTALRNVPYDEKYKNYFTA